jgi:hypothetical protein
MKVNVVKEIFGGRELTVETNGICTLSRWRRESGWENPVNIPNDVANYLIGCDILVLDSGNFETGEEHYVYDRKHTKQLLDTDDVFERLKPILREVRLNDLVKNEKLQR